MKRSPLESVKHLIEKLSSEERQELIPFLASLPDSGLNSYDLREELGVIQETSKIQKPPPDATIETLFSIVIPVRNVTEIHMKDLEVLRVIYRPDHFIEAFPFSPSSLIPTATESVREGMFTDEMKGELRAQRKAAGITTGIDL